MPPEGDVANMKARVKRAMEELDDVKDRISDDAYLVICDALQDKFKQRRHRGDSAWSAQMMPEEAQQLLERFQTRVQEMQERNAEITRLQEERERQRAAEREERERQRAVERVERERVAEERRAVAVAEHARLMAAHQAALEVADRAHAQSQARNAARVQREAERERARDQEREARRAAKRARRAEEQRINDLFGELEPQPLFEPIR